MTINAFVASELQHLEHTAPLAAPITGEDDLNRKQEFLDALLDYTAGDENHVLAPIIDVLGDRIEEYEAEHYPMPEAASAVDLIRHLMEQHQLRQQDLPEIGSQGVVSEVLAGKRELNVRQARALAERFALPIENFLAA